MDGLRSRPVATVWVVALDADDGARHRRPDPLGWLDADERARAAALRRPLDRHRYVAAHVALRRILGWRVDRAPGDLVVERAPCPICDERHGRPELAHHPEVRFSLARTAGWAAIAVAPFVVGVDVESWPTPVVVEDLAAAFHPDEVAALAAVPHDQRDQAAVRTWTRKEALLKGWGTGLGVDPADVAVGLGTAVVPPERCVVRIDPTAVTVTEPGGAGARRRTLTEDGWCVADLGVHAPVVVALASRPGPAVGREASAVGIEVVETTVADLLADPPAAPAPPR